jgi:hypothetical protein
MYKTFGWVLLLGLALGCRTLDPWGDQTRLEEAQRSYTQMMRWGDFERASVWVDPEELERFFQDAETLTDVRVSDYQIGNLEVGDDGDTASVRVSYRVYSMASLVEKEVLEVQDWYYDDEQSRWQVRPKLALLRRGARGR